MLELVSRILLVGLTIGCIYALTAIGLNLLWGTMRMLNVAHGSIIMLGAYGAYWFFTLWGVGTIISGLVAVVGGAALGLLMYKVLFASALRRAKSLESVEVFSYLTFFGVMIFLDNAAAISWSGDLRGYSYLAKGVSILGTTVPLNRLLASAIAVIVSVGFFAFLQKTMVGKAIRAVIEDKGATQLVGVNVHRIYAICFAASMAMAALAGSLLSMFYPISPYMGTSYTLTAFVVVVLGGLGNIMGSLVAGLVLGVVTTGIVAVLTPGYGYFVQYLIFVLVILFMPAGLFGKRVR